MRIGRRWMVIWAGWDRLSSFRWRGFRFNGGGYLYGAAPYYYWQIGPIVVKRFM